MRESADDMDTLCRLLLTSMMSECAKSFERLPILLHADILRNVLYSGVWSKYEYLQLKNARRKRRIRKKSAQIARLHIYDRSISGAPAYRGEPQMKEIKRHTEHSAENTIQMRNVNNPNRDEG